MLRDLLTEILESVRRNKLRTCLTGFAVAWGIFMLIVLLGAGNGLMNAFLRDGSDVLTNTMTIYGGATSKPYDGLKQGRQIRIDSKDLDLTRGPLFSSNIDDVAANLSQGSLTLSYGSRHASVTLTGTYPSYSRMNKIDILAGRYVDELDIRENRKMIVMPSNTVENVLLCTPTEAIGRYVRIGDLKYCVAGVYKADEGNMSNPLYISYTTLKTIFSKGEYIDNITFSFHGLESLKENEDFEAKYRSVINGHHRAAPDDTGTLWIWNRFKMNLQMDQATSLLTIALWIIGIFTLLSGIVGVSNIMLITVKERTHEFGIRKAIGASPASIMRLIISESISITAVFGYIGMLLGLFACDILDKTLGHSTMTLLGTQVSMLKNPTVGVDVALEATLLLIIAGTIAGLVPARKAAKVRPIEALRAE